MHGPYHETYKIKLPLMTREQIRAIAEKNAQEVAKLILRLSLKPGKSQ